MARHVSSWSMRNLAGGERLWSQGEPADQLAWVVSGRLRVVVDDRDLGEVGAGGLLGELSVFLDQRVRAASVIAMVSTTVQLLDRRQLEGLRASEAPEFDEVLGAALVGLAQRVDQLERRLPCALVPVGRRASHPDPAGEIDAAALLRRVEGLGDLSDAAAMSLALGSESVALEPGQVLVREGEPSDGLLLVASGEVLLCRAGEPAVRLGPGVLWGADALVRPTRSRETIAAVGPSRAIRFEHAAWTGLTTEIRRELSLALLAMLRGRLLEDNAAEAEARGSKGNVVHDNPLVAPAAARGSDPASDVGIASLPRARAPELDDPELEALLRTIREGILGGNEAMVTPFGLRRVTYADYTASGRPLRFVEDFIRDQVMPLYANTHTEASASGLQTTRYREEARQIIADSVGASEQDAVLFVGSGATGAINRLLDILGLRVLPALDEARGLSAQIPPLERPVVFIGPYEHHSNILPWHHSIADLVMVMLDDQGQIDLVALELQLQRYADRPLKIGSFSAASNVTGVASDVLAINTLLHRHGALSFWDYAAAGPYVEVDMNPVVDGVAPELTAKDAVFLSPHKFVGGPGTPGLLVMKRSLSRSQTPSWSGGGTVDFVSMRELAVRPLYSDELEHREEAGTPAIIESIRCGLVFQLKQQVGAAAIRRLESGLLREALRCWQANPNIDVLGPSEAERLSITSFMVRHGRQYLHYNYVIALLNDLFGIQARGGCSCAGPYGGMLLRLDAARGETFLRCAEQGWSSLKPGWARVNFNYFISEREFRYIVDAIQLVALHGWALLPSYDFDPRSGLWTFRGHRRPDPQRLESLRFDGRRMRWSSRRHTLLESALEHQLVEGRRLLEEALVGRPEALEGPDLPAVFEANRWFPLPHEVAAWLRGKHAGQPLNPDQTFRAPIQAH